MRHRISQRKLGRSSNQRKLMFRVMVTNLLRHGRMTTTTAKAKSVRPLAEKWITIGTEDNFNTRRKATAYLTEKAVVEKLFTEVGPKYKDTNGGYTRITKLPPRAGDAADMAVIELVEQDA